MFPGLTTKISEEVLASAATINPTKDLVRLTGSTAIATINPNFGGGFSGILVLVPNDGTLGLLTTGNIAIAVTMPLNRATVLVYSKAANVWYPGAIS
jgi:hypothetical protein